MGTKDSLGPRQRPGKSTWELVAVSRMGLDVGMGPEFCGSQESVGLGRTVA